MFVCKLHVLDCGVDQVRYTNTMKLVLLCNSLKAPEPDRFLGMFQS